MSFVGVSFRFVKNCSRSEDVATASSAKSGRSTDEDCGALKKTLGSLEDFSGKIEEEEEFVVADVVDITVDVGNVNVDEFEETGVDRQKSVQHAVEIVSCQGGRGIRSRRRERCHDLKTRKCHN